MAGFGGSVKLTGESEYRKAIQNITQDLSKMSSALKTQTADYSANDKATTSTAQKQKELSQAIDQQKQKLSTAKNALAQYTVSMQAQQTRYNTLNKEYKNAVTELDRIKAASGEASDEYKKQAAAVDKLGQELAESTAELNESKAAMSALKSEINSSQKTISNTQKALDGLGKEAQESGEKAKKGGDGFTVMKGVLANLATNAIMAAVNGLKELGATVVNVGKEAVNSYADYEQLSGGVKKLFGNMGLSVEDYAKSVGKSVDEVSDEWKALEKGQNDVLKNASKAYETAGMSANEYMETVTGFSASLISGLDGDTVKAAKVADTAIQDMADNANTFGTNISSIQDAYQGFAKQNYTMLDNLKLGYGGTQSEMARLINDSGVLGDTMEVTAETVNDVSFDKIIEAIHKIQDEQKIAGTTSREAAGTIEGSKNMMLASWKNLLTGMADENQKLAPLFGHLVNGIVAYMGNLLPRISEAMKGMSEAIKTAVTDLFPQIQTMIQTHLPELVQNGVELISSLIQGLVSALPMLVEAVMLGITTLIETLGTEIPNIVNTVIQVVPQIVDALMHNLPTFIQGCITFLNGIVQALPTVIENLVAALPTLIQSIIDGLINSIDALVDGAVEFLTAIVDAIPLIIPPLVAAIPQIIETLINGLVTALPQLMDGAIILLMALIDAIPRILPPLVAAIPQIITSIVTTLLNNIPLIVQAGVNLLVALVQNLPAIITGIVAAIPEIITGIVDGFAQGLPQMAEAGLNLIKGLVDGILGAGEWVLGQVKGFFDGILGGICDFLGINSPSTVMRDRVGKNMADGIGEGFSDEMGNVSDRMEQEGGAAVKQVAGGMKGNQSSVMNTAKNLANAIIKTFKAFKAQFTATGRNIAAQITNGFKTASKQVMTIVKSLVSGINSAIKASSASFTNAGKSIATNFAKGIASGKGTATSAVKAIVSAISAAIKAQVNAMRTAGRNLIAQLTSGMKSGQSTAANAAKAIANAIATAFNSKVAAMKTAGMKMAANLANGIKSGSASARSAATSIASAAVSGANGYYNSFYYIGVNMAKGIKDGFLSQKWAVKNAVNNMVDEITESAKARQKIASPSKVWAEIGDYMAQGMAVGFTDGMGNTNKTMLNAMGGMLNDVYSFWGISSPSKVMRDKVGKQLVAGITEGIKANQKTATNAFKKLQKAMLKTANASDYSAKAKSLIKAFDSSISDSIKQSEEKAKQQWENWYNAQVKANEKAQASLSKKIKAASGKSSDVIAKLTEQYTKDVRAADDYYQKQIRATNDKNRKQQLRDQLKATKQNLKDQLAADKKAAKKSVESAKKVWQKQLDTLKDQKKTLTKEYKTLGTSVLKAYNTAMKNATEGVTDALAKDLQNIADTMQKRMDEVNDKIDDMRGKLKEYGDLFTIDDQGVIELEDLNQQTKNIQRYGQNLEKLKGKISSTLMDEIVSLGIEDGLAFTNKLLNISASELKEYDKAYTAKVNAANNVAEKFYSDQVKKIKDSYTKKVKKALNEAKKEIETIGKQTMQGFVKGMKSVNWAKDVKSIANDIIKSFKKQLKIKSPSRVFMEMGEYSGEGYTIGLADEMKNVSNIMAAAIPDTIGAKTAGIAQNPAIASVNDAMTPDKMVSAFKEALYQVKIELDNDEMGRFVDKTVTRLVYS